MLRDYDGVYKLGFFRPDFGASHETGNLKLQFYEHLNSNMFQFKLSTINVGLLFLLVATFYGLSSPGIGWLSDKFHSHWSLKTLGLFGSTIGVFLLDPSIILPAFRE